jgi:caspase domain-containing protein
MKFCSRLLLFLALLFVSQPASAEKRVALVIGNSNYKNAATLPNPANDAAAIAATLKRAGFDVVDSRLNLSIADMRRVLRDFADQARDADMAVVYYAGHGIEIDGTNYLIPTDATLERDTDVYDEAFSLDRVLLAIEPARQLRLVIVDACRNNPFAETMKRTVTSRTVSRGLARVEPTTTNTLVAFAAKAGLTALDGNSKNSPYAAALVKYIAKPGLDLRRAFGFVRDDVLQATGNRQEPYVYGSLGGADVSLVPAKPAASTPTANSQSDIRKDFELALQLGNKDAFKAFLAQYPDGYYASLAKLQLAKIAAEETQVAATEKARLAEQERTRLSSEGAKATEQEKAAADAQAAEEIRANAEKTKQAAQEQAAEAERQRIAADQPAAAAPPESKIAAIDPSTSEPAAAAPAADTQGSTPASENGELSQAELARQVQTELRRVGCMSAKPDGKWSADSQHSLALFNRNAGTRFDVKLASIDALDAIKLKPSRVCPLICEHGFRPNGDHCSRIVCARDSVLDDDNECVKRRTKTPTAKREPNPRHVRTTRSPREHEAAAPRASGQIVCTDQLCRPVQRGCHIEFRTSERGGSRMGGGSNVEICN